MVYAQMSVGDRLRLLMKQKGLTQVSLAKLIGLTQPAISNLVTDDSRQPSASTLLSLANALEVNPQWILDGIGEPSSWSSVTDARQLQLLHHYVSLSPKKRAALMAVAMALSEGD